MPNNIDNRIVNMQFNNGQFEKGVHQSLGTLDKLKAALKFDKAAEGLSKVERIGNNMNFTPLATTITEVSRKFSALEIAAIAAINNITNRALNFGITFTKSLSIDQVTAGWTKFADKAQSVSTIMAATSKPVEVVGHYMELLNKYTDETSANFTDMTANIGKFTNAGVSLDDAVVAMQGITNWGFRSGANIGEMSRAMYNLSQAMAVGSVKLIDWKSVENANMATQEFKQTAIDTAVAMGQLRDVGNGVYKTLAGNVVTVRNFNEALKDNWLSSEVLTTTLQKYGSFSNDLVTLSKETGVAGFKLKEFYDDWVENSLDADEAVRITGKSLEELEVIFRGMGTTIGSYAKKIVKARNENKKLNMSEEEIISTSEELAKAIRNVYAEWFAADQKGNKYDLSDLAKEVGVSVSTLEKEFRQFSKNVDIGKVAFEAGQEYRSLSDAINAVKDAVSTGWMNTFEQIFGNAEEAKRVWTSVGETLLTVFGSAAEERNALLRDWHVSGGYEVFVEAIENIGEAVSGFKDIIDEVFDGTIFDFYDKESIKLVRLTEQFRDFTEVIKTIATGEMIKKAISDPLTELNVVKWKEIYPAIRGIENIIAGDLRKDSKELGDAIKYNHEQFLLLEKHDKLVSLFTRISETVQLLTRGFSAVKDIVLDVVKGLSGALDPVLSLVKTVGGEAFNGVKSFIETIIDFNNNRKGSAVERIGEALSKISDYDMSGVGDALDQLDERTPIVERFKNVWEKIEAIIGGVVSAFNLAKKAVEGFLTLVEPVFSQLKVLGEDVFNLIVAIFKRITKTDELDSESGGLLGFFSKIKSVLEPLITGIGEFIHNLLTEITKIIDPDQEGTLSGIGQVFKDAFDGVAGVVEKVAPILSKAGELLKSAFDFIVTNVEEFMENANFTDLLHLLQEVFGVGISVSLLDLFKNLKDNVENGGILGKAGKSISEFFEGLNESINKVKSADALMTISKSLLAFAAAILILSFVPAGEIEKSIGVIVAGIGGLIGVLELLGHGDKKVINSMQQVANAILKLSLSLLPLAIAMKIMSSIDINNLAVGLTGLYFGLAAMVAVLALLGDPKQSKGIRNAAKAMATLAPVLIALAASLFVLSLIPLNKMATALLGLIGGIAVMVAAIGILVTAVDALEIAPSTLLTAAGALLILAPALIALSAALAILALIPINRLGTALLGLTLGLADMVAALALLSASTEVGGPGGLLAASAALLLLTPAIIGLSLALAVLSAIPLPNMVNAILGLGAALFLIAGVAAVITPVVPGLLALAGAFLAISAASVILGVGLVAISAGLAAVGGGVYLLVDGIISALERIVSGIVGMYTSLYEAGKYIITGILQGIVSGIRWIFDIGKFVVEGLLGGIGGALQSLIQGGLSIAGLLVGSVKAALGINSPSTVFAEIGDFSIEGLLQGIDSRLGDLEGKGSEVGSVLTGSLTSGIGEEGGEAAQEWNSMLDSFLGDTSSSMLDFESMMSGLSISPEIDPSSISSLDSLTGSLDGLNTSINTLSEEGVNNLKTQVNDLVVVVDAAFSKIIERFQQGMAQMQLVGRNLIRSLANGIRQSVSEVTSVTQYIVMGLVNGINGLLPLVASIGRQIGSTLLNGARSALDVNSPSREFAEIGQYSVMGLLGSINSMLGQVETAGKSVGETLMTSTMDALNGYDHIMDDHILNPVVDLSTRGSLSGYSLNGVSSLGAYPNVSPIQNGSTTKNISPVFNIYQQPGQDEVALARIINRELGRVYQS